MKILADGVSRTVVNLGLQVVVYAFAFESILHNGILKKKEGNYDYKKKNKLQ